MPKMESGKVDQIDPAGVGDEELRSPLMDSLPQHRFLADGEGAPCPASLSGPGAALLVGPEGGFTPAERAQAIAAGFVPIGLGPHVLRTETAALVGASALLLASQRALRG